MLLVSKTLLLLSATSLVTAGILHGHGGAHATRPYFVSSRAVFQGFRISETDSLKDLGLGDTCEQVLYQSLKCDDYVARFSSSSYHRSLNDQALTTSVCDKSCQGALTTFSRRANVACAGKELFPGYPVAALIDTIWGGWNETCVFDIAALAKNCNDVIESWPEVDSLEEMPKANLCSYCYTKKLAVMQQNRYGVYSDGGYQATYDYVVKTCGLPSSTVTTPSSGNPVESTTPAPTCQPDRSYTAKSGDTCDSIAKSNLVSSGSLFAINPMLMDCAAVVAGSKLCLPPSCEKLYEVKTSDSCPEIAVDNEVSWQNIVQWNGMIDPYCSNIDQTEPNFGKTLCVSPPGGTFTNPPANETDGSTGGPGGSGDGYSDNIAVLPTDANLATGSTTRCGLFYTAQNGDTCETVILSATTPADLFVAVNPSLGTVQECNSKLVAGLTYCTHPNRDWNNWEVESSQPLWTR